MKPNSLNLAISVAIASILIFLLGAVLNLGMMAQFITGALALVVVVALPIIFIRKERLQLGGFITFGDAFRISFFGLLIGGAVSVLFTMLYIQFIDPEYAENTTLKAMEMTKNFMDGNVPEEQIEETLRKMETDMGEGFTPLGMAKSFLWYVLFYVVLSSVLAAFLKKDDLSGMKA
jgi:hypothetical protein